MIPDYGVSGLIRKNKRKLPEMNLWHEPSK